MRKLSLMSVVASFALAVGSICASGPATAGAAVVSPADAPSYVSADASGTATAAANPLEQVVVTAERRQLIGNTSTASEGEARIKPLINVVIQ